MVVIEGYNLPEDLYYTERNLWVKPEPDGAVRIGFNDLAAKTIGKVAFIRLMPKGRAIEKGKFLGSVESAKWVERLRSPVSGTILEVNRDLRSKPSLATDDPYGGGWFVRVKPTDTEKLQEELEALAHGETVKVFLEKQLEEIKKEMKK